VVKCTRAIVCYYDHHAFLDIKCWLLKSSWPHHLVTFQHSCDALLVKPPHWGGGTHWFTNYNKNCYNDQCACLSRKPEKLHVVWLRGHRRADSPDVQWISKTEGGKAIDGRATFDPPIASALLVTLYQTKVCVVLFL